VVCIITRSHGRVCIPLSSSSLSSSIGEDDESYEIDLEGALERVESGQLLDDTSLVIPSQEHLPATTTTTATTTDDDDHERNSIAETLNLLRLLGKTKTANILVEAIPSNPKGNCEPVLSFLTKAISSKLHVVSANKSPLAHTRTNTRTNIHADAHSDNQKVETYWTLQQLAHANNVMYNHESAVMDGVPIFSLWKYTLPYAKLISLRGCLNSTTTMILTRMEERGGSSSSRSSRSGGSDTSGTTAIEGETFEEALAAAKHMGIVEEDDSLDLDGYDAAVKLRALLVYCSSSSSSSEAGIDHDAVVPSMEQIHRDSIRNITREDVRCAYANGRRKYRLVASARLVADDVPLDTLGGLGDDTRAKQLGLGNAATATATTKDNGSTTKNKWEASVRLQLLLPSDPLYNLSGTDSSIQFCTDVLGPVTVVSSNPTLVDTAYGLLSDIVRVASESQRDGGA